MFDVSSPSSVCEQKAKVKPSLTVESDATVMLMDNPKHGRVNGAPGPYTVEPSDRAVIEGCHEMADILL